MGGQIVGSNLPEEDMMVLGISIGNIFDSVKPSLGQPTQETSRGLTYGGVYIYLNTYSIESVQYAPPKYALRGTYYVVYTSSYQTEIIEKQLTVNYDTSHSLATLIHSPRMMNRNSSMMDLMKASDSDSGLFMNDTAVAIYTLDGVCKRNPFSDESMNQKIHRKNTIMYDLADAMFMSVYQQHFDDIVIP